MFGAWQGERFAREDKLRSFGHYLKAAARAEREAARKGAKPADRAGQMLASFVGMQQAGVPVSIKRLR